MTEVSASASFGSARSNGLLAQQERIERALAKRHLGEGTLVLYDVSVL